MHQKILCLDRVNLGSKMHYCSKFHWFVKLYTQGWYFRFQERNLKTRNSIEVEEEEDQKEERRGKRRKERGKNLPPLMGEERRRGGEKIDRRGIHDSTLGEKHGLQPTNHTHTCSSFQNIFFTALFHGDGCL